MVSWEKAPGKGVRSSLGFGCLLWIHRGGCQEVEAGSADPAWHTGEGAREQRRRGFWGQLERGGGPSSPRRCVGHGGEKG